MAARKEAEEARVRAEEERDSQFIARISAEQERDSHIEARLRAELDRDSHRDARLRAELEREEDRARLREMERLLREHGIEPPN